ncbi:nSTAND1 domain-containing NTPase, partial [Streptomyces mirabilis]|uniref:nSTAND1 domain-containing NTPase n=1 Tax=Streptomyces mirabilis TaxID=68239 RepID=UPI003684790F
MAAFDEDQAGWFFGRDAVTAELLIRLDERLRAGGALALVAPSGAGKSSLLRAGLLPALARGALPAPDSATWPRLLLTPGAHPVAALAAHLADATRVSPQEVTEAMAAGVQACLALLRTASAGEGRVGQRLVVVVDQLEEMFTLCTSEQERRTFLSVLTALADAGRNGAGPAALVVYGLRSDFYTPCADHPELRAVLQDGQLVVGPMTHSELREAILFPARAADLDIEPGLVELLLRDLGTPAADGSGSTQAHGYEAGRLPLLAHALRATWQQRHGHNLTVDGYQATGGIRHAVATTAERVFTSLGPAEQQLARALFLRLVRIGDSVDDTRRRLTYTALLDVGADAVATAAVIDAYTRGRLLTRHQDTVEITHEALLYAWPELRRWIDADRAGHLIHQDLEEAATDWDRARRDPGMLYRGHRLEGARAWVERPHQNQPSPNATAFLTASARHAQRATRLRRSVIAILAALALVASAAAVIAFQQRATAQAERDTANFNQIRAEAGLLRDTDASLAAQLDLVAYRMRPDDLSLHTDLINDANMPLSTPLAGHTSAVTSVAISRDGRTLASAGGSETRLWDLTNPTAPRALGVPIKHDGWVNSVAFSPDGRTLVTGEEGNEDGGSVQLWDLADRAHPTPQGRMNVGSFNRVLSVAFSPDKHTVAAATDEAIRLWNVADATHPRLLGRPLEGHTGTVWTVAFSPDGRTLASSGGLGTDGTDSGVRLWDVADPAAPKSLGAPIKQVGDVVAFSPDGRTLAGSADGAVRLWNVTDPRRPRQLGLPLRGHTSSITSVTFSPDGHTLATAGYDRTVRLWNLSNPTQAHTLGPPLGYNSLVSSIAFSPDGHTLATGGADRDVRLWTLPRSVVTGHPDLILTVAISPDGHLLASGGADHAVRLWNLSDPARPRALSRPFGNTDAPPREPPEAIDDYAIRSLAFSADGHTLATGGEDDTVKLWNLADPSRPQRLGRPISHQIDDASDLVSAMAFSPHRHLLAVVGGESDVWLWDLADPTHPKLLIKPPGTTDPFNSDSLNAVAFSPDG